MTVPQRFEAEYRVRFDEADGRGFLRPSGFLRFAQDVAWLHSEAAGFGREWYAERAVFWLVHDVELRIVAPLTYGDRPLVSTAVVGWRHVWVRRQAQVRHMGSIVATIETDWVLMGTDMRPVRLPDEIAALLVSGQAFRRRRSDLAATPSSAHRHVASVRPTDVDPMGHLNNAAYLDLVDDARATATDGIALPADRYTVSYLQPAMAGAQLEVASWPTDDGATAYRVSDASGVELMLALVSSRMP